MSVELVNGYVLFPNGADWNQSPEWKREWQNEMASAVTGQESRIALRAVPRVSLTYQLFLATLDAQSRFNDRVRAALKSGLACAPYHGRGCAIKTANSGANQITLTNAFPWQVNDYVFLSDPFNEETPQSFTVTAASLSGNTWTLMLSATLSRAYSVSWFAWPLLFGKFIGTEFTPLTSRNGRMKITIKELTSNRSVQLGTVPVDTATGIGHWRIGTTFQVQ